MAEKLIYKKKWFTNLFLNFKTHEPQVDTTDDSWPWPRAFQYRSFKRSKMRFGPLCATLLLYLQFQSQDTNTQYYIIGLTQEVKLMTRTNFIFHYSFIQPQSRTATVLCCSHGKFYKSLMCLACSLLLNSYMMLGWLRLCYSYFWLGFAVHELLDTIIDTPTDSSSKSNDNVTLYPDRQSQTTCFKCLWVRCCFNPTGVYCFNGELKKKILCLHWERFWE